jgi:hypothetical protein
MIILTYFFFVLENYSLRARKLYILKREKCHQVGINST